MAKKTLKSNLLKKLGTAGKKAVAAHKSDEVVLSAGGDLPPGIDHGIAQLVDCKFDTYKKGDNKGEFFFRAAGIVLEPKTVGKITVSGLRTQIMEPLCDTPNRSRPGLDDHVQWVLNELRKLGVDTTELNLDTLEEVAEALEEEQPTFAFRTWQGEPSEAFPNPRVNHDWRGAVDYVEDETTEAVEDLTEEVEEEEEEEEVEVEEKTEEEENEEEEDEENEDEDEASDLNELAESADEGDEEAQGKLTDLAEEAGIDADSYVTWIDLSVALDEEADEKANEIVADDEDEEDIITPEKSEVYGYKPPRAKKAVECEVTAVFLKKETCNLKSLDDGKVFKSVPFAKLLDD